MKGNSRSDRAKLWMKRAGRALGFAAVAIGGAGAGTGGCLSRPLEPVEPRTTSTIVERLTQSSVDKIDLLLAIDNSRSMADKQAILALAVPDLVQRLVNPLCVDPKTGGPEGITQPAGPLEDCPPGTEREFDPIVDIHIGIISSSIGGHGSDACPDTTSGGCAAGANTTNNDRAHLLARKDSCSPEEVPTYNNNKGFLFWDPTGKKGTPPGEANQATLIGNLKDMVIGVGQIGCGYEASLESIYRFLADPNPYEKISVQGGKATPEGQDKLLLQQRADFMRPSSLLAVILLTDENDCSVIDGGQYFYATQLKNGDGSAFHLPKARSECASNPDDPCCFSCGQQNIPAGCGADANCGTLSDLDDNINLRCYEQKRRFGIDFLYPTARYINMFQQVAIDPKSLSLVGGSTVPNPIYSDLNPKDADSAIRDTGLVFFAGIVGVPWQAIARDKDDLTKGFKNGEELAATDDQGKTVWDAILGDPAKHVPPSDPHMVETYEMRPGINAGDPIVDHDYTIAKKDDLQYACIFPLLAPRDCSDPAEAAKNCDCATAGNDNPLCSGTDNQTQSKAKGYPGLRELAVLKGIGTQGITASVCPKQIDTDTAVDFGYRPAVNAIIDRLKTALGGQCLPRSLTPDTEGRVSCIILEARKVDGGCGGSQTSESGCKAAGHSPVSSEHLTAIEAAKADPVAASAGWNCFCEIDQLVGAQGDACRTDIDEPVQANGKDVDGWCYIDATTSPPTGDVKLVEKCADTEKRIIRFVGEGEAQPGATLFITCTGE